MNAGPTISAAAIPGPGEERVVRLDDAPRPRVVVSSPQGAWRYQLLVARRPSCEVADGWPRRLRRDPTRIGMWPVVGAAWRIVLSGIASCTYCPTSTGAIASSVHCMTSVGTVTRARSLAVVGEERDVREVPRDFGIGAAEALGESLTQLRTIRVAHDHRGAIGGPTEIVRIQSVEEGLDVDRLETAAYSPSLTYRGEGPTRMSEPKREGRGWRRARRSSR